MGMQFIIMQKALLRLSDRNLQIRSWTGVGPEVSSPFESIDDFKSSGIEDYIIDHRSKFNDEEFAIINELFDLIDRYDEDESDVEKINTLIDSNYWMEIRRLASKVLSMDEFRA